VFSLCFFVIATPISDLIVIIIIIIIIIITIIIIINSQ